MKITPKGDNVKVAFYKNNSHLFNRLVAWWTKGKYSHMELVFSDGLAASSSNRDRGVRYKRIHFSPANWDVFELDETFSEEFAREYFNRRLDKRYDIKGLFGFVWQAAKDNPNKEFCSEVCMGMLVFAEPWRFSPNQAFPVLKRFFK